MKKGTVGLCIGRRFVQSDEVSQAQKDIKELVSGCINGNEVRKALYQATGVSTAADVIVDTFRVAMVMNLVDTGRVKELTVCKKIRSDNLHNKDVVTLAVEHGVTNVLGYAEYIDEGIQLTFTGSRGALYKITVYGDWYTHAGVEEFCAMVAIIANGKLCGDPLTRRGNVTTVRFETENTGKLSDSDLNELAHIFNWARNMFHQDMTDGFANACVYRESMPEDSQETFWADETEASEEEPETIDGEESEAAEEDEAAASEEESETADGEESEADEEETADGEPETIDGEESEAVEEDEAAASEEESETAEEDEAETADGESETIDGEE